MDQLCKNIKFYSAGGITTKSASVVDIHTDRTLSNRNGNHTTGGTTLITTNNEGNYFTAIGTHLAGITPTSETLMTEKPQTNPNNLNHVMIEENEVPD